MNTTSYHPLQCYKHFCNLLDSNKQERDSILSEICKDTEEIAKIEKRIGQRRIELTDTAKRRAVLIETEGKPLLPLLKGWRKCYDVLKAICDTNSI